MSTNIYDPEFVKELFNKMSKTYERMNYITSFGFSEKWRHDCINVIPLKKGDCVADLMTGMGECWKPILTKIGYDGKIISLDFSEEMLKHAVKRQLKYHQYNIEILNEDVFKNSIKDRSVDSVISGFGIKTFSAEQIEGLAKEIKRILKPGGSVSLIDVSVPDTRLLKILYVFYLKRIIPILGKLFLGNPETYKMLGQYVEEFKNAKQVVGIFKENGFEVELVRYFYGCATGVKAKKH